MKSLMEKLFHQQNFWKTILCKFENRNKQLQIKQYELQLKLEVLQSKFNGPLPDDLSACSDLDCSCMKPELTSTPQNLKTQTTPSASSSKAEAKESTCSCPPNNCTCEKCPFLDRESECSCDEIPLKQSLVKDSKSKCSCPPGNCTCDVCPFERAQLLLPVPSGICQCEVCEYMPTKNSVSQKSSVKTPISKSTHESGHEFAKEASQECTCVSCPYLKTQHSTCDCKRGGDTCTCTECNCAADYISDSCECIDKTTETDFPIKASTVPIEVQTMPIEAQTMPTDAPTMPIEASKDSNRKCPCPSTCECSTCQIEKPSTDKCNCEPCACDPCLLESSGKKQTSTRKQKKPDCPCGVTCVCSCCQFEKVAEKQCTCDICQCASCVLKSSGAKQASSRKLKTPKCACGENCVCSCCQFKQAAEEQCTCDPCQCAPCHLKKSKTKITVICKSSSNSSNKCTCTTCDCNPCKYKRRSSQEIKIVTPTGPTEFKCDCGDICSCPSCQFKEKPKKSEESCICISCACEYPGICHCGPNCTCTDCQFKKQPEKTCTCAVCECVQCPFKKSKKSVEIKLPDKKDIEGKVCEPQTKDGMEFKKKCVCANLCPCNPCVIKPESPEPPVPEKRCVCGDFCTCNPCGMKADKSKKSLDNGCDCGGICACTPCLYKK